MTRQNWRTYRAVRNWWLASAAALLMTLCGASGSHAQAAGLADHAHSLRSVPADVAFYSASLRLKEQFDIFLASNVYRKLMEIPIVQMGKMQVMYQWEQSPEPAVARFREYFNSEEGQEALALLKEMFAGEIFVYGDKNVAGDLKLLMELNGLNRGAKLEALASGEKEEDVLSRRVLEFVDEHAEQFVVPNIVWGYRIKDAQRATKHLDRIQEVLSRALSAENPELADHLKREQIAGNEFLVMRLDGTMIPWDRIRKEAEDVDDEQFARWQEILSKKTAVAALGVVGEFVWMSVGDSTDHLEKVGTGPSLADQPAMARLAKHAAERVTSIGYVSKAFSESLSSPRRQIDDLVMVAEEALDELNVEQELRSKLMDDLRGFGDDVLKYMPEPGDIAVIGYLTARGYESYQYQTGTRPTQDSSQPLTVLDHAGGNPMMLVATRTKQSTEDYDQTISWLKRIAAQVELIAKEKAEPDDWAKYLELREKGLPLLERLNTATRAHVMPALANGEQAFVVDAAATSKQWIGKMPKSPQPLPVLEFGFAVNVSDAEHLRQGVSEYFDVIQQAVALLHEMNPEKVPEIQVPEPETRELADGGTMYIYSLPAEWGIDPQLAPNAALTKSVAAASLTPAFTERLLRTKPLEIDTSLDLHHPAATVSYFEFARLIDVVKPWVDYGGAIATGQIKMDDEEEPAEQTPAQAQAMMAAGMVVPQIDQFLDVAAAMRSVSSVTYHDDGAWVTHSEAHFQDVK